MDSSALTQEGWPPKRFNGRDVIFASITGSHNYHLNEEGSDEDWKVLVLPTLNDIYSAHTFTKAGSTPALDYTVWDFRRLPELLWKSNPNVLEMLFSEDIHYMGTESDADALRRIVEMRDDIARMNLPYMFNASMGIAHHEIKKLDNGSPDKMEKFGYSTKHAMHAYRTLEDLDLFAQNGFEDFGSVVHCDRDRRDRLLAIKHGEVYRDADHAREELEDLRKRIDDSWRKPYAESEPVVATSALVECECFLLFREHWTERGTPDQEGARHH